ncbi:MAG TPA: hypothetical protein VM491_17860 [Burkholderiaceae bacterium]|nr:hypothetical protein [Burkholderiaceae bacterium]
MRYLAAVSLGVLLVPILWFELLYLAFGITGRDASNVYGLASLVAAAVVAIGWPLRGTHRPAQVVRRSCMLGIVSALLLPVVAVTVLMLWLTLPGRPDLGMGGLMLYSLPWVAAAAAVVLTLLFGLGSVWAGRRLQPRAT